MAHEPGGYFRDQHERVMLGWQLVHEGGLRRAQLGAAWAICAHDTVSKSPALVVLPTGVGKTLVLCLAPFLVRARRVLVVAPGKLVRTQIATAFETLTDLKTTGVLPEATPPPRVAVAEHRATATDWSEWRRADVVVGTPNVLSDGYPEVQRVPPDLFDLVIFDEAHHLPARVWEAILQAVDARSLLLTATPTRRDGRPLPGELIYTYPLSMAIADGVYAPVRFRPVPWTPDIDPDQALATAAASRLASPLHRDADSRLLVRTGSQSHARQLVDIYRAAGLELGLVLADTRPSTVRRTLREVKDGAKQGFIAVGAMIEGFDFPSLKIAAYHQPHRSLAPTLQFIGRLSRVGAQNVRGELLAIPEHVEGETRDLYRENRDWAELMPEIVEAAETREREIRRFVARVQDEGPLEVPLRAFTPPRSARIYRVATGGEPDLDVHLDALGKGDVVFRLRHHDSQMLGFVTRRAARQRWARSDLLIVDEFEFHLITWVREQRVLFVSTESPQALDELLEALGVSTSVRKLSSIDLSRLVRAADPGTYFSVGLRAAQRRRAQGASYDMTAGPAVQGALSYEDRHSTTLGHVMARPNSGNRGTVGLSVAKSKLWEPENAGSLFEFREWALERAAELDQPAPVGLPGLDVQLAEPLERFEADAVGATVDPALLTGEVAFLGPDGSRLDPADVEWAVEREDEDAIRVTLTLDDQPLWRGLQSPFGQVSETENHGTRGLLPRTGEIIDVTRLLQDWPLAVFLADGATVLGDVVIPGRIEVGALSPEVLASDPWDETQIDQEIGPIGTVQARTAQVAVEGAQWVATDHGSGELADFISLAIDGMKVRVGLFHCKGSGGPIPGRRVGDLYEVIGQAVKSIPWTIVPASLWPELLRRIDHRNAFRVLHGDADALRSQLEALASGGRIDVAFEVTAVQPGVSVSDLGDWQIGRALVHAAVNWCASESVAFRLLGSA